MFLNTDHLGSTSLVTNASGGVVGQQRYYPYGTGRPTDTTLPTDYRFTGQRRDAYINLYQMGDRWYDPELGRFISADTVVPGAGNPQALNRYAYVLNNPLKYTDPTGHANIAGTTPDDTEGGKYIPPPPIEPPTCGPNGELPSQEQVWIYQALIKVYYNGGSMGRQWVRRYAKARPPVWFYDDAGLDPAIQRIGGGHWFGIIMISKSHLGQAPDAWWSSVLIHEFVHYEQRLGAWAKYGGLALLGVGGLGAAIVLTDYPTLEKERGAQYVQFSILYEMNDPDAIYAAVKSKKQEDLAVEIGKLKTGGLPVLYQSVMPRNPAYQFWWPSFGGEEAFPVGF